MEYYGTSFWAPTNTLAHHGIKGQKWGTRHWQNEDGTFNEAGKKRYFGNGGGENYKPVRSAGGNARRALAKVYSVNEKYYSKHGNKAMANANKQAKERMLKKADEADKKKENRLNDEDSAAKREKIKKAAKIGAVVAGTALVAYGAYKLNKMATDKLKAGDLAASRQHKTMAKMHLDTMLKQQSIANDYRRTLSDSSSWDAHYKLRKMENNAGEAGIRYLKESRAASELAGRAAYGKYSVKDKAGVIYNTIKRR